MKKIALFLTLISLSLFAVKSVSAEYGSYQPSTFTYSIVVDKLVGRPVLNSDGTINYVDNIPSTDRYFNQSEDVLFQVKVKNTSNTSLSGVILKDFVPSYVDPIDGIGTYDANSRTITANIGDFAAGEEKLYYFKMRTNLGSNISSTCVSNKVQVSNDKANDDDMAQFCLAQSAAVVTPYITTSPVQGVMTKVEKVPSAGPEYAVLITAFASISGLVGLKLRKAK